MLLFSLTNTINLAAKFKRKPTKYKCPSIPTEQDLFLDKINGTWYRIMSTQANTSFTRPCEQIKFGQSINGIHSVYRKYISPFGLEVKSFGMAAEVYQRFFGVYFPAFSGGTQSLCHSF